ncbi:MAG: PAS domain S-box protein [bacterium]|nr:PAS domain S-box protein [bacterium]
MEKRRAAFEIAGRNRSGAVIPMEIHASLLSFRESEAVLVIARDITTRRQQEEERECLLQETGQRAEVLNAVIESTHAHLVLLDRSFRIVMANSAYVEGSGYTLQELIGQDHFKLFPNAENEAIFQQVRATGSAYNACGKPFEYADQPDRSITYWNWLLNPTGNRL